MSLCRIRAAAAFLPVLKASLRAGLAPTPALAAGPSRQSSSRRSLLVAAGQADRQGEDSGSEQERPASADASCTRVYDAAAAQRELACLGALNIARTVHVSFQVSTAAEQALQGFCCC